MSSDITLSQIWPYFISILPLAFRYLINFRNQEINIIKHKKELLRIISFNTSINFGNSLEFNEDIIEIDDDFKSLITDKVNNYLFTITDQLASFYSASLRAKRAILWIRILKYNLVCIPLLLLIIYVLFYFIIKSITIHWLICFISGLGILIINWIIMEIHSDKFNSLCNQFEVERNE